MKKLLSLLLALVLVFSLVACSTGNNTPAETTAETAGETAAETAGETAGETAAEAPVESDSAIATIGLGTAVELSGKPLAEGKGSAQQDVTIAGLAFDSEGKIVQAHIDVAQSKFAIKDDGTFETPAADAHFKTKMEKGDEYGMRKASGIGKEWNEQAEAFAQFIIGKTAAEVEGIATEEKNDHPSVPADPDLVASVTMDIGAFKKAVADAAANTIDANGATQLGLGVETHMGSRSAEADAEKGANAQFETYMALTATDADGKIVANRIDVAQNAVAYGTDGQLSPEQATEGTTKQHKGEEYGMRKASSIGKEWFEQVNAFSDYIVGKTGADVAAIPTEKRDEGHLAVPTEADLVATTTVTIDGYQAVIAKSLDNLK